MKLILGLEIIFIILENSTGLSCHLPYGLHIYEMGIVYTISCSDIRLGIQFDKQFKNFTKSPAFSRAICNENGDILIMSSRPDVIIFCADMNCMLPDSVKFSTNLSQHFNGSVIATTDRSEIYYCIDAKWYSLFQTILPKDFETVNKANHSEETLTSHKPWSVVKPLDRKKSNIISPSKPEYRFPSFRENDFLNNSDLRNLQLKHSRQDSLDLCGIAIICTVICSFFFLTTIILVLSSRFAQKNQLKRRFIDSKISTDNEKFHNNHRKEDIPRIVDTGGGSRVTEYTKPTSKLLKDIEAGDT